MSLLQKVVMTNLLGLRCPSVTLPIGLPNLHLETLYHELEKPRELYFLKASNLRCPNFSSSLVSHLSFYLEEGLRNENPSRTRVES